MKKVFTVLMLLGAATVAFAEDSYLYWMIGDGANDNQYSYDKVVVRGNTTTGGSEELYLYFSSSAPVGTGQYVTKSITDNMRADGAALYAKLASDTTYSSFVIELYNADNKFLAQSDTLDFSTAVASYYIATNNSMSQLAMWAPTSFAIPEPNSAMLILLGCAALGLKRRRQLKA